MRYAVCLTGLLMAFSGCTIPRCNYTRVEEQTLETDPLVKIDLSTFNGNVEIIPHDGQHVELAVTYKAYGATDEEAQMNCELMGCDISADDGVLKIKATKPSGQWMAYAGMKLEVPSNCELALDTSNGKVTAHGMESNVHVHTSNGSVQLEQIAGAVSVKTSNGTINVKDSLGPVDLKTSNGRVTFAGVLVGDENKIRTSNGSVTIELPSEQLTEVSSSTSNGSIKCSVPTQRIMDEGKRSYHAVVGDGAGDTPSAKLSISTSNGSIRINPLKLPAVDEEQPITEAEVESESSLLL